jgi:hypothetical protein
MSVADLVVTDDWFVPSARKSMDQFAAAAWELQTRGTKTVLVSIGRTIADQSRCSARPAAPGGGPAS